jgi:hypothetical protein
VAAEAAEFTEDNPNAGPPAGEGDDDDEQDPEAAAAAAAARAAATPAVCIPSLSPLSALPQSQLALSRVPVLRSHAQSLRSIGEWPLSLCTDRLLVFPA